jgi:hypothetical protein
VDESEIKMRIANLRLYRDRLIANTNLEVAKLNGGIAVYEQLLEEMQEEAAKRPSQSE